jgi:DNA replication protein DnaC
LGIREWIVSRVSNDLASSAAERWHDIVGNPTLADAILDRILHNAHRVELRGESMRKRRAAA